MKDIQPIVRILLRYFAMSLMTGGYLSADTGALLLDPAILTAITGAVVGLGTELWYLAAKYAGNAT